MIYDMEMQKTFYASYAEKVEKARKTGACHDFG